ncbi:hypothetical protein Tco_0320570, partial [Tanacetum coccineum]
GMNVNTARLKAVVNAAIQKQYLMLLRETSALTILKRAIHKWIDKTKE